MREDLLHSSRGGSSQKLLGGPSIWGSFNNIIIDYYYYNSIVQYSTVCSTVNQFNAIRLFSSEAAN